MKLVDKTNSEHRALKLIIYPNLEQEILINKTFGCVRKIYNIRLDYRQAYYDSAIICYDTKEEINTYLKSVHYPSEKELKEQYPYLKEVSAQALCAATMAAEQAYSNWLNSLTGKRKGRKVGKPRFKSRKSNNVSYKDCQPSQTALNRGNKTIKIPKIGEVKYRNKRINDFFIAKGAVLKSITVRKNPAGEYYAVLLFEREYVRKPKIYSGNESKAIGLDFPVSDLYIDSNGNSGKNFGYVAQKQARRNLARLENHIANSRLDFIEKESLRLVRFYELIGVEDLNLQGISSFLRNAKNMVDTSWGAFTAKLIWKASKSEHNCQVIKVSRHFPSSQLCSKCGFQNKGLELSERKWVCPSCGAEHSRDFNAALNIKGEIIRQAMSEFRSVEDHLPENRDFSFFKADPMKQKTKSREIPHYTIAIFFISILYHTFAELCSFFLTG